MNQWTAQFNARTRTFNQIELPIAQPQPNEVLVQVTCCTICGSDLHTYSGRRNAPDHCVLGHEIVGTIADWGPGNPPVDYFGLPLDRGQRVTWNMAVGCGECFFCNHELSQKCDSLFKYGHETCAKTPTGGLSQYCLLVPNTSLFKLPESLPDQIACPANCAGATVAGALRLTEESHSIESSSALVIGAGMLGLNAVAQLKVRGAADVFVIEPQSKRRDLAIEFGATECFESFHDDFIQSTARHTDRRGVDIVYDFSGVNEVIEQGIERVRIGGLIVLVGSVFPTEPIHVCPEKMVRRALTIRGLHNYLPKDLQTALDFLQQHHHRFPFESLVERTFRLDEVQAAFEYAQHAAPIRVAIEPN